MKFPNASKSFIALNPQLSHPEQQQDVASALGDPTPGKTDSSLRVGVRFTSCRTRLLDQDNLGGGAKILLDQLVGAGLIIDDSPKFIDFEVRQEKVSRKEEKTIVEIFYP